MSNFLGQAEAVDVFQCPNCNHFNSSRAQSCAKCSMSFSDEQKQTAIENTKLETKRHNIKYYKNILIVGLLMFFGGGGLAFLNIFTIYLEQSERFTFRFILVSLVGIGNILWGVRGIKAESKN